MFRLMTAKADTGNSMSKRTKQKDLRNNQNNKQKGYPMLGMSMSLNCSHRQVQRHRLTHRCEQRQALTMEQRHSLRQDRLNEDEGYYQLFLSFVNSMHSTQIRPMAKCPKCDYDLRLAEIVLGFKTDVDDLTTQCPRCKIRFLATNLVNTSTGREVPFFCPSQVLERMAGLERLEVREIRVKHPDIYSTAVFHFGSLYNAFGQKGITYRREKLDWSARAKSILGEFPDWDIARVFGVPVKEVKKKREELSISHFTGKSTLIPADWKPLDN
jgi:hypothetical protein